MNAAEMAQEGRRLSHLLDAALAFLKDQVKANAEAEKKYRLAKSEAWLRVSTGTAAQKEAWVDAQTADDRYKRDLAAGLEKAAHQAVRARLAEMSLLQSVANAYKAEAAFDRYGPEAA